MHLEALFLKLEKHFQADLLEVSVNSTYRQLLAQRLKQIEQQMLDLPVATDDQLLSNQFRLLSQERKMLVDHVSFLNRVRDTLITERS